MPDSKGIKIGVKDVITVVGFLIMVITFTLAQRGQAKAHDAEMVLLKDQVERNTVELNENDLGLIVYKIEDLEKKVDRAIELLLDQ